jgi:hypothetical protein
MEKLATTLSGSAKASDGTVAVNVITLIARTARKVLSIGETPSGSGGSVAVVNDAGAQCPARPKQDGYEIDDAGGEDDGGT